MMEGYHVIYIGEAETKRVHGRTGTPVPSEYLPCAMAIWEHEVCTIDHLPLIVFATFKSAACPS